MTLLCYLSAFGCFFWASAEANNPDAKNPYIRLLAVLLCYATLGLIAWEGLQYLWGFYRASS